MSDVKELQTISRVVDGTAIKEKKIKRISLPPQEPPKKAQGLKYSNSHNLGQLRVPQVPATIPEVEVTETAEKPSRNGSVKSYSSTSNGRKVQMRNELTVSTHSYENGSYDGPLPEVDRTSKQSFDTRSNYSNLSSRNPSLQSLQVQREQYCCASKWSPCERKLVAVVTVLATIIVILVIILGYMAGNENKGVEQRFQWNL